MAVSKESLLRLSEEEEATVNLLEKAIDVELRSRFLDGNPVTIGVDPLYSSIRRSHMQLAMPNHRIYRSLANRYISAGWDVDILTGALRFQ